MILKAIYGSKDEIPAGYEALYHSKGGKWVLNTAEIEGVDEIVSPDLNTKIKGLETEKTNLTTQVTSVKQDLAVANQEVAKYKQPGTKIITKDESDQLEAYQKLGPVKDLETLQTEVVTLRDEKAKVDKAKELETFCKESGVNFDVLSDQLDSRLKDVEFFTKKEKTKDAQKKDVEKITPMIRVTVNVNGKEKIEEHKLDDYAKAQNFPDYVAKQLFTAPVTDPGAVKTKQQPYIPASSTGKATDDAAQKENMTIAQRVSSRAKQESSTRRKPWDPAVQP